VLGTQVVLEACRRADKPLVVISTDEVYGSIRQGSFTEDDPLQPNNPYAATKAGADLLVPGVPGDLRHAGHPGPGVQRVRTAPAPREGHPDVALNALDGGDVPVYGNGKNRREWLFVRDFATAVMAVMAGQRRRPTTSAAGTRCRTLDLRARSAGCGGARGARDVRRGPARARLRYALD
jgi:dTDP-glucose 4,6-dehydratase